MASNVNLPSIDFDILRVQGQSLEYKIPSKPVFPEIDITFYDITGMQTKFEAWTDKIWNPRDGLFEGKAPTQVKAEIEIQLLEADGSPSRIYKVYGAWPKKISHSQLNMSDDNLKTLIVQFVYDYYVLDIQAEVSGSGTIDL